MPLRKITTTSCCSRNAGGGRSSCRVAVTIKRIPNPTRSLYPGKSRKSPAHTGLRGCKAVCNSAKASGIMANI
jgi:hypothetical protein